MDINNKRLHPAPITYSHMFQSHNIQDLRGRGALRKVRNYQDPIVPG